MKSLILSTATRFLKPLLLLFSIFILLVGHNEPGGGFVGGLLAASAFMLHALAHDVPSTRLLLRIDPRLLIGSGLLVAVGTAVFPLLIGKPFMTGIWGRIRIPGIPAVDIGTPLFFDTGVYLLVMGISLLILFSLKEE